MLKPSRWNGRMSMKGLLSNQRRNEVNSMKQVREVVGAQTEWGTYTWWFLMLFSSRAWIFMNTVVRYLLDLIVLCQSTGGGGGAAFCRAWEKRAVVGIKLGLFPVKYVLHCSFVSLPPQLVFKGSLKETRITAKSDMSQSLTKTFLP